MAGIPESLITVEFAETMHKAAVLTYQQAARDVAQYALLGSALLVRRTYPTATHLIVTPSDQGPHMTPAVIVDPECGLDDNEIEEYYSIQDQLWGWLNDLDDEDPWGLWFPFVTMDGVGNPDPRTIRPDRRLFSDPTGRANHWALDLDLILFHHGNAESAMEDKPF